MPVPALLRRLAAAGALIATAGAPAATDLAGALRALAAAEHIELRGLERLGNEPAPPARGDNTLERVRALLAGYNHVVEGTPDRVRRVIILGEKTDRPPLQVVRTTRRGNHHLVDAAIRGPSARPITLALILDTGASSVVLPASLIPALGFRDEDLAMQRSQTANGTVSGRAGTLAEVRVGGSVARDVAVLFVPDESLGGVKLLGMSYLGNFSFTVDDAASQIVLTPR